nr:putative f-box/kelch-repeat protein [Quercus suber]
MVERRGVAKNFCLEGQAQRRKSRGLEGKEEREEEEDEEREEGEMVSPVSKVAEDRPPGPYPSRYYAVLDDHLYSVGGPDPDFSASTIPDVYENYTLSPDSPLNIVSSIPTTEVWMLDLKCPGKGWERAPSMKYRRQNPQTIVVDGKLYVFGGLGWLQPKDTFSGWMEFYDPKLRTWETLPNPPTYSKIDMDVIFAHSSFKGKDQIIINGPPVLEEGDSNGKGHYIAYDVISLSWNHMFHEAHLSWAEEVQCKRAQVVSTTLYWTTLLTEHTDMIFIYGYNAYSRGWTRRKVNIRSILIEGEDFLPTGPGFLHLADFKFCLLLFSYRRPHYYLNCLIFDLYGEATKQTAMVRPVLHIELGSSGFLRIENTGVVELDQQLEMRELEKIGYRLV